VAAAAQPRLGSVRGRRREGGGHTWWARGRARRNGGGDRRESGGELGGGGGENGHPDGVGLKLRGARDLENFRGWTWPFICAAFLQAVRYVNRLYKYFSIILFVHYLL
jgi:hypothetical protein